MTIYAVARTLLLVLFSATGALWAQVSAPLPDEAKKRAVQFYRNVLGVNSGLYNGYAYKEFDVYHRDIGHPYFGSDDWVIGAIRYDGQGYTNVPILYDVVRDKLVIENPAGFSKLELIAEKIENFSFTGHNFVRLSGDSTLVNSIRTGLYEVLYDGKVKVFARRKKEIEKDLEFGVYIKTFRRRDTYYIFKNGAYFPVRSRFSVLAVFEDQKASIRRDLASNKIRFKREKELAIRKMAAYYDESVKQP